MKPVRTAFVMEQALGHVTHYRNLRAFTELQPDILPSWLPIPFDAHGAAGLVPMLRSSWSVRASWRARRALLADIRRNPTLDAIVFHTQVTSLFSIDIMKRIPALISLDATPINYDTVGRYYGHRPAGTGILDRQKYLANRNAFHAAARLVTWSDWARRSLLDDYAIDPERVSVLAAGAADDFFEVGQARLRRLECEPRPRPLRLLFVGGAFDRKGGQVLLECLRGPLGSQVEAHIVTQSDVPAQANVFVYRGVQPNSPALLRLFADADIFVLPTYADCLGMVLMEATAAALPVVTTSVGAMAEAVLPGVSGLLVPTGNPSALSAALCALVEDPHWRQRMSRAAFALASEKFSAARNNRQILNLVSEIAAGQPSTARFGR